MQKRSDKTLVGSPEGFISRRATAAIDRDALRAMQPKGPDPAPGPIVPDAEPVEPVAWVRWLVRQPEWGREDVGWREESG